MADDPKKRGKADRDKVAAGQKHEVDYMRKTTGATAAQVKAAITAVGNNRKKVKAKLKTLLDD